MAAISLKINQVVQDVLSRTAQTEEKHTKAGLQQQDGMEELMGRHQRDIDQDIFGPLVDPQRRHIVFQVPGSAVEGRHILHLFSHSP